MNMQTKLLAMYIAYILLAAGIVFFLPHKYSFYCIGLLVVGLFGLWRMRRVI